jgi:hypothetical protein
VAFSARATRIGAIVSAPDAVLESRRAAFLSERPRNEEEAQKHLARAQVTRALQNVPAALAVDPLNLSLQQAYWSLRRQMAGKKARP